MKKETTSGLRGVSSIHQGSRCDDLSGAEEDLCLAEGALLGLSRLQSRCRVPGRGGR